MDLAESRATPRMIGTPGLPAALHYFGDGCPLPHGSPDAPIEWADPWETLGDVRARVGQPPGHAWTPVDQGRMRAGVHGHSARPGPQGDASPAIAECSSR